MGQHFVQRSYKQIVKKHQVIANHRDGISGSGRQEIQFTFGVDDPTKLRGKTIIRRQVRVHLSVGRRRHGSRKQLHTKISGPRRSCVFQRPGECIRVAGRGCARRDASHRNGESLFAFSTASINDRTLQPDESGKAKNVFR